MSEEHVPLNTRDILEKGLTFYGSSRSTNKEFETLMKAFQSQGYQRTLTKLLSEQDELIRNARDLERAKDKAT